VLLKNEHASNHHRIAHYPIGIRSQSICFWLSEFKSFIDGAKDDGATLNPDLLWITTITDILRTSSDRLQLAQLGSAFSERTGQRFRQLVHQDIRAFCTKYFRVYTDEKSVEWVCLGHVEPEQDDDVDIGGGWAAQLPELQAEQRKKVSYCL